jgi:hypothetical protein
MVDSGARLPKVLEHVVAGETRRCEEDLRSCDSTALQGRLALIVDETNLPGRRRRVGFVLLVH